MVICSLDALKKSSKSKESRIEKEMVQVLQQAKYQVPWCTSYRHGTMIRIGITSKKIPLYKFIKFGITLK